MPANSEEQRPQQRRSGDAQDIPAPAHAVSDNGMKAHLSSWTGKHEEVEGKYEEAREAPLPQSPPPSDDVPIADRRLVSAELDAQRSTAFRGDKEEWTRLRTFVHDTEEKSLLKPYTFPFGCTIDFEHIEAYILSLLPLSMFVLFVAMINAFAFTDPDTDTIRMTGKQNASNFSSSANVSRGASANATVEGVLDPRAKMLAAASAGSKDNAVLTAFGAALNIILIGFIAFSCARHRVPQLYSRKCKGQPETTKGQRSNLDCLPARGRFGCFSWLPDLLRISDESMVDHIGFDAYIFLRLLQLASKFAAFSFLLVGGPLMVVYYHADGDPSAQGSLRMLTLSNVGQDDWRLWLCLAGMYVVSLLLVKLVSEEEMVYVRTRHRYFHQPRAQDYSCIVKDIPEAYRTNHDLLNLFRKFYPAADIDSVCVLPDCRALEKHVTKSKAIVSKLKEAKEARENGKAKLGFGCCAKSLNKLVPKLREELQELNELIHKEQLAVHRALQTTHQAELEALHLEEKEFFSHKASSAPNATDGGGGAKQHAKQVALHKAKGAQIRAAQALEAADKCMLTKIMCSVTCGALKESYGDTRQHGIVTFSNLRTATIARQVVHDSHVLGMELVIKEAPEPDDFCWRNAGMNKQERFVRGKLSVALDLWLLALWSVPVVAITAMTSVESLSLRFPILKPVVEQPFVKSFIEGTLPSIILTQFLNHLPSILRATSIYEGHMSMSTIERHTVGKYYMFLVFNVFLLTTFSNGLLEGLEELVADPLELPNILARTLPSQSNFFLSYILVNGIST